MNTSLTNILFVLIVFQLLFLSLFLFTQEKGKRVSNVLLGSFFLSIALNLLDVFLLMTGAYSANPYLAGWGSCLPLLFGPLIYFYTRSVIEKGFAFTPKALLHFLPFLILFSVTEFFIFSQERGAQEQLLESVLKHHLPKSITIVSSLVFIQFLVYIICSLRLVSNVKKSSNQYFSNKKQIGISWLSSTIFFFLAMVLITIINGLLAQTSLAVYYLAGFNIVTLAMLVFVITVLLKALQKPHFFSFSGEDEDSSDRLSLPQRNFSDAERTEKDKTMQAILNYMQTKKPYLEPELNLQQLAAQLSLKPRTLSETINEIAGQNFYDFINRYRIEEASRLLTNPKDKKITILEVLYEVGFNSKSSFNTLFKKYKGLTPTEFRKNQSP